MSQYVHKSADMPIDLCYWEVDYEWQLELIIGAHLALGNRPLPTMIADVVGVSRPYEQLSFLSNWSAREKEADLECQIRCGER